jgi:hypothetical protein
MKHKDTFKQTIQDIFYRKAALNEVSQQTKNDVTE